MATRQWIEERAALLWLVAVLLIGLAVFVVATPSHAQAGGAPPGSYRDSCTKVEVINPQTLVAWCNNGGSQEYRTTIYFPGCAPASDIWNTLGTLYCIGQPSFEHYNRVPGGSYLNSCNAISVEDSVLIATCSTGGDDTIDNRLTLSNCDTAKGIDNVSGQLKCVPRPTKAATPMASASPPPSGQAQAFLKAQGCSWFLGRANQYLCTSAVSFSYCAAYVAKGEVKSCMAPNQLPTDCRHNAGFKIGKYGISAASAGSFVCVSRVAYLQCENLRSKAKAGITQCQDSSPKPKASSVQPGKMGRAAPIAVADGPDAAIDLSPVDSAISTPIRARRI